MSTQHTPGPWAATNYAEIGDQQIDIKAGGQGDSIAVVLDYNNTDECIANARLIARAPEMAEALRNLAGQAREAMRLAARLDGVLLAAVQDAERILAEVQP